MEKVPILSKSDLIAGMQCPKRLFLQKFAPDLRASDRVGDRALMAAGHRIGLLARTLFPNGAEVGAPGYLHTEAIFETEDLLRSGAKVVYEAAFAWDSLAARLDILALGADQAWQAIEVKSATTIRDMLIHDIAFQVYVLRKGSFPIRKANLLLVNRSYIFMGGDIDPHGFFNIFDVTSLVASDLKEIEATIGKFREILKRSRPPEIRTGFQCTHPYRCPFFEHCHQDVDPQSVEYLPGLTAEKLAEYRSLGVETIQQMPDSEVLSEHRLIVRALKRGGRVIDMQKVLQWSSSVRGPVLLLDAVSVNPAIPIFAGTRPYQNVPLAFTVRSLDSGMAAGRRQFVVKDDDGVKELFTVLADAIRGAGAVLYYGNEKADYLRRIGHISDGALEVAGILADKGKDVQELIKASTYAEGFGFSYGLREVVSTLANGSGSVGKATFNLGEVKERYMEALIKPENQRELQEVGSDLLSYCIQNLDALEYLCKEWLFKVGIGEAGS